ncbi:hypothetical protein CAEBREN_12624 [Caenorhabditis brenneri]|uniref:Uncharacterized protein n=1 Tax=Caenorhabditis brenneri TaxID=135651 RepID=G0N6S8_CAEBE|nr:hypothetical protein CAEBREN_12624 [Caenorhabditis brenneri]
MFSTLFYIRTR